MNRKKREKIKVAVNSPVKYEKDNTKDVKGMTIACFDGKSDELFIATCLSLCAI